MLLYIYSSTSGCLLSKTLHVSDSPSVHHQQLFTVHTAMYMSYRFADSLRAGSERNQFGLDPASSWFYYKNFLGYVSYFVVGVAWRLFSKLSTKLNVTKRRWNDVKL